jgi:hypothetical protein
VKRYTKDYLALCGYSGNELDLNSRSLNTSSRFDQPSVRESCPSGTRTDLDIPPAYDKARVTSQNSQR